MVKISVVVCTLALLTSLCTVCRAENSSAGVRIGFSTGDEDLEVHSYVQYQEGNVVHQVSSASVIGLGVNKNKNISGSSYMGVINHSSGTAISPTATGSIFAFAETVNRGSSSSSTITINNGRATALASGGPVERSETTPVTVVLPDIASGQEGSKSGSFSAGVTGQ